MVFFHSHFSSVFRSSFLRPSARVTEPISSFSFAVIDFADDAFDYAYAVSDFRRSTKSAAPIFARR